VEPEGRIAHVKGAPEAVLPRCVAIRVRGEAVPLTDGLRAEAEAAYRRYAAGGMRLLALARRPAPEASDEEALERDLTLLGVVALEDPPRPEARTAVARAHEAGIRVVMITGDAPETALAIAREVGLDAPRALTGADLDRMDGGALAAAVDGGAVFARTAPEHKLRLVGALQARGEVVAMTGDGVNDAPALKKADVGVAMGRRGTDVARSAADVVLTDDHFASIIGGVEEGRRQGANVRKFVRYLLTTNAGEVLTIFGGLLLGGPLVLLPAQILWINLLTDGPTALALGLEPAEPGVMRRPPRDPRAPVLGSRWLGWIALSGLYLAVAALLLFERALAAGGPYALAHARTAAFTGLVVMQKVSVFNFRTLGAPLHTVGLASNPRLLAAVAVALALQVAAVYFPPFQAALGTAPLTLADWGLIVTVAMPVFIVPEARKLVRHRRRRAGSPAQPEATT
jgi:Ca2+-transporting ATPase